MRMHNESRAVAIVLSSPGQHPARTAAGRLISSERAPHCLFPFQGAPIQISRFDIRIYTSPQTKLDPEQQQQQGFLRFHFEGGKENGAGDL